MRSENRITNYLSCVESRKYVQGVLKILILCLHSFHPTSHMVACKIPDMGHKTGLQSTLMSFIYIHTNGNSIRNIFLAPCMCMVKGGNEMKEKVEGGTQEGEGGGEREEGGGKQ